LVFQREVMESLVEPAADARLPEVQNDRAPLIQKSLRKWRAVRYMGSSRRIITVSATWS
jgi:hypothetical protein